MRKFLFAAVAALTLLGPIAADLGAANAQQPWLQRQGGAMRESGRGLGQPATPGPRFAPGPRPGGPGFNPGHVRPGPGWNPGNAGRPGPVYRPPHRGGYGYNGYRYRHHRYYGGYYNPGFIVPFFAPSLSDDCYWVRRYGVWHDRYGKRHRGWHRVRVCD